MAVPVARVHLAMAHAALPPLLPTPTTAVWNKMLPPPLLPTPPPCLAAVAAMIPNPNSKPLAKAKPFSRADADERWDAHKINKSSASSTADSSASSSSPSPRSAVSVKNSAGRGSCPKNATSPSLKKPGRADSAERWDAHKKSSSPSASSPSSPISRASSAERWDVRKKLGQAQAAELLDDGEKSSTGSNDIIHDTEEEEEEEEIVWKPRQALYAGAGFAVAAPEPSMLPMPSAFLVLPVA